jgi:tetratricopeptide (TPR) repeat protein
LLDVFAMQSEIAQAVAAELKIKLLPEEKQGIEQPPTRDLAAYELFLRAKDNVNGYLDAADQEESLRHAVRLLEEATVRDPQFILAYCFAARAHNLLYALRLDRTEARKLLARSAVDAALRLQPNSAEAHLTLADHMYRCGVHFEEIEQELALARPGLTNSTLFHFLDGSVHRRRGRWAESDRSFARAVELDPNNTAAVNLLADNYVLQRQYAKAILVYERALARGLGSPRLKLRTAEIAFAENADVDRFRAALEAAPADLDIGAGETPKRILVALARRDYAGARRALSASSRTAFQDIDFTFYYPRSWYEASIARAEGCTDEARAAFAVARLALHEILKLKPGDVRTLAVLAQVDAALGQNELALAEAQQAVEIVPVDAYDGPLVLQGLAQVYTWSGEKELALGVIENLVRHPGYLSYGYLRVDPSWDPLRGDPRFEAIVRSLRPL